MSDVKKMIEVLAEQAEQHNKSHSPYTEGRFKGMLYLIEQLGHETRYSIKCGRILEVGVDHEYIPICSNSVLCDLSNKPDNCNAALTTLLYSKDHIQPKNPNNFGDDNNESKS